MGEKGVRGTKTLIHPKGEHEVKMGILSGTGKTDKGVGTRRKLVWNNPNWGGKGKEVKKNAAPEQGGKHQILKIY